MPSLQDLIDQLQKLGVLASEVIVPRKMFSKLMERGSEISEEDEEED